MVVIEKKFSHPKPKISLKYLLFDIEIQLRFLLIQKALNLDVHINDGSTARPSQPLGKIVTFGYGNRKDYDSFLHYSLYLEH